MIVILLGVSGGNPSPDLTDIASRKVDKTALTTRNRSMAGLGRREIGAVSEN